MTESAEWLAEHGDDFADLLKDEPWCRSYGFRIRWPEGFVCPYCGASQPDLAARATALCSHCGRRSSITAGTLLHGSKKEFSRWLQAIWWLSGQSVPLNIRKMQRHLGLNSYQTAWTWMTRLRQAIHLVNRKRCRGIVLIDAAEVDGDEHPLLVLAAVESIAEGRATGRLRMTLCRSLAADIVARFCRDAIECGSVVAAPNREPFVAVHLPEMVYTCSGAGSHHDTVQAICTSFRHWCARKDQPWRPGSDRERLEEFCHVFNSALASNRLQRFEALVSALLSPAPAPAETAESAARPGGSD